MEANVENLVRSKVSSALPETCGAGLQLSALVADQIRISRASSRSSPTLEYFSFLTTNEERSADLQYVLARLRRSSVTDLAPDYSK